MIWSHGIGIVGKNTVPIFLFLLDFIEENLYNKRWRPERVSDRKPHNELKYKLRKKNL